MEAANASIIEDATIPVENINGPILLISGQDDQIWPSTLFSEMIGERLEQYSYSYPYTHLDYAGAGHAINVPYLPTTITAFDHPIPGEYLALGGNPVDSAFANADSWSKVLEFLRVALQENNK